MTLENTNKDLLTYEEASDKLEFPQIFDKNGKRNLGQFKRFLRHSGLPYVKLTERVRRIRKVDLDEYIASHMAKVEKE